jgi:hypothetical protein
MAQAKTSTEEPSDPPAQKHDTTSEKLLPLKRNEPATSDQGETHAGPALGSSGLLAAKPDDSGDTSAQSASTVPNADPISAEPNNISIRPKPIHEISLKVANSSSSQLDIHVVERAGNVRVAVRTPDQELSQSLQTNLGELVGRLEEKGYKTETWLPSAPLSPSAAPMQSFHDPGYSQDQPRHSGSWAGSQQQSQQQNHSQQQQPARWINQLKKSLDESGTETARMEAH